MTEIAVDVISGDSIQPNRFREAFQENIDDHSHRGFDLMDWKLQRGDGPELVIVATYTKRGRADL